MKALFLIAAAVGLALHLQGSTVKKKEDKLGSSDVKDDGPVIPPQGFESVPNHPYCSYAIDADQCEDSWIVLRCSYCDSEWRRKCTSPNLYDTWIWKYSLLHAHDHHPTLRGKAIRVKDAETSCNKGCTLH
jgi:hypothetical protein